MYERSLLLFIIYLVIVGRYAEERDVLGRFRCSDSLRNRLGGGKVRIIIRAIFFFVFGFRWRKNIITRNGSPHLFYFPSTFAWTFVQRQTAKVEVSDWCDTRNFPVVWFIYLEFARIYTSAVSSALMMMIKSHSKPVPQTRGPSSLECFRSHYLVHTANEKDRRRQYDNRLFILTVYACCGTGVLLLAQVQLSHHRYDIESDAAQKQIEKCAPRNMTIRLNV